MMAGTPVSCSACGAELPADAPYGLCPACIFQVGERTLAATRNGGTAATGRLLSEGRQFGDYELLEEIARGGMGVVFKARQRSLNRIVAVKMILGGHFAGKQLIQRFRAEVTAAALLQHPNIVAIHEVGVHEDQHFFSMDYVEGQNLSQLVRAQPLPAHPAARYMKIIAEAIHYAHEQGILHRDLKPSNVLVDSATDQPRLTDFGLAKRIEGGSSITFSGEVLGSPNFMPPEQASAERGKVGRQSDVYGLGAILYYLITARPPFQAETLETTVNQVLNAEPLPPRRLNAGVPRDLETICLKCLEKEPERRYRTAQELADELGQFLKDEPIQARPLSSVERGWRWCRRKPALASAIGLASLLLLMVAVGAPIALIAINRERVHAEEAALRAQAQTYTSDMNRVLRAWEDGDLRQAKALLNKHTPTVSHPQDLRGIEWRYLWQLCQETSVWTNTLPDGDAVCALVSSPAHSFVAARCEKTIRLFDPATGREVDSFLFPHSDQGNARHSIALATEATNLLAACNDDGEVALWNLGTKTKDMSFKPFDLAVATLSLSPDGKRLAAADRNAQKFFGTGLAVWDISNVGVLPRKLWSISTTNTAITVTAFSPDGRFLLSAWSSKEVVLRVFDAAGGQEQPSIRDAAAGNVAAVAFSPDGTLLASAGVEGNINVWDVAHRTRKALLEGHAGMCLSLSFSASGEQLISGGYDGTMRLWDVATQRQVGMWRVISDDPLNVAFAPDGKWLVSGAENTVNTWTTEPRPMSREIETPRGWGWPLISPNGRWLVVSLPVVTNPVSAAVWDLRSGQQKLELAFKGPLGQSPAFSPDGRWFALGDVAKEGLVGVWNTSGWEKAGTRVEPFIYLTNQFEVGCVNFSADGKILAAAGLCFPPDAPEVPSGATNRLAFWEAGSWNKLNLLPEAGAGPTEWAAAATAAFSSDGRLLAVGSRDGWVRLWDIKKERAVYSYKAFDWVGWGVSVGFSKDNHWLSAVAFNGPSLVLFDLENLARGPIRLIPRDHGGLHTVEFAPDSQSLVTAHNDGLVKFWNLRTLACMFHTPVPQRAILPESARIGNCGARKLCRPTR